MLNSLLQEDLTGHFEEINSVLVLPYSYIPRRDSNILQKISFFFKLEQNQLRVGSYNLYDPVCVFF